MEIGFPGLLALLFIGLKLGGVIAWSWFWVLSPLFAIPVIITVFTAVAFFLVSFNRKKKIKRF